MTVRAPACTFMCSTSLQDRVYHTHRPYTRLVSKFLGAFDFTYPARIDMYSAYIEATLISVEVLNLHFTHRQTQNKDDIEDG